MPSASAAARNGPRGPAARPDDEPGGDEQRGGERPERFLGHVAEVAGGQDRGPGAHLGHGYERDEGPCDGDPEPGPDAPGGGMEQKRHWATKHSSAAVATERPISTLESQESIRPNRCTSARGMSERNPQPSTNTPESRSCLFRNRPTGASAVADWRATRRAVRCHPQALTTATAQSTVHHAATPLYLTSAG